jgi:hypothetical protein
VADRIIENPIINSPYRAPNRYFRFDDDGITNAIASGRRPSQYFVPVPRPRKRGQQQIELDFAEFTADKIRKNDFVNQVRDRVEVWRKQRYPHVTPTTRRLLEHWSGPDRDNPILFAQREAAETAIYLAEAGQKAGDTWIRNQLNETNAACNLGLQRAALKMATGSGKTVVMTMLIAWQTLNKVAQPNDVRFAKRFLVITPGLTIRDRLRVLLPEDENNYYKLRGVVPADLHDDLGQAKLVIANYHQLQRRETKQGKAVGSLTKELLAGTAGAPSPFRESWGQMVARVCRDLGGTSGIVVLNDEAHHCYLDRYDNPEDEGITDKDLTGDAKAEAKQNTEAARLWFNGLRAINERLGVKAIYRMGHHQVAAGRHGIHQPRHDPVRVIRVGDEVQDRDQQDGDRPAEIERPRGALEDRVRVPKVRLDVIGLALGAAGQQRLGVAEHHRVIIGVDDPRLGSDPLRDVVGVVGRRQAGPDIEELPDALAIRQLVHRVDQEQPRGPGDQRQGRHHVEHLLGRLPVGGEIVLAAQPVVPHPRRVRHGGVEGRQLAVPAGGRALGHEVKPTVTEKSGGKVADGFAAFGGSRCAAGLLIKLPDGTRNIHPSLLTAQALASTISNLFPSGSLNSNMGGTPGHRSRSPTSMPRCRMVVCSVSASGTRNRMPVSAPVSGLAISATEVDALGAATVTQRKLSPIRTSSRFSKPSVPTKNSTALSWSLTGIPTVPMSVMVVWDMTISSRH